MKAELLGLGINNLPAVNSRAHLFDQVHLASFAPENVRRGETRKTGAYDGHCGPCRRSAHGLIVNGMRGMGKITRPVNGTRPPDTNCLRAGGDLGAVGELWGLQGGKKDGEPHGDKPSRMLYAGPLRLYYVTIHAPPARYTISQPKGLPAQNGTTSMPPGPRIKPWTLCSPLALRSVTSSPACAGTP